jgi:glycosyltransferase involved in cell wall biosynthesis
MIVHDCRHVIEPAAFSRGQRAYRNGVLAAAAIRGSHVITISEATRAMLASRWPRLADRAETVRSGVTIDGDSGLARLLGSRTAPVIGLAFGHLPNKRPETAARAWLDARTQTDRLGVLYVVGIEAEQERARLHQLDPSCQALDVRAFLPTREFEDLRTRAGIVLLPSTHEGFGLPVLEALVRHQVPVISPDAALVETARGRAVVVDASSHVAFAQGILQAVRRIDTQRHLIVAAARSAGEETWGQTWQRISDLVGGAGTWRCNHCAGTSAVSRHQESE